MNSYNSLTRTRLLRAISTAAMIAATPQIAAAQATDDVSDLRDQIGSLQAQVDDLREARDGGPSVSTGRDNVRLELSGRVNTGFLFAAQGPNDQAFVVDNDGSGSRFGLTAEADVGQLTVGVEIEISAEVNSTDDIDFDSLVGASDDGSAFGDVRQANFFIESDGFGFLSIGQGDTAAEDSAHADLSGTSFAGAGSDVDDIAGGLVFVTDDGSPLAELDDFFDVLDGGRDPRILYKTPGLGDFKLRFSLSSSEDEGGLQPAIGIEYERDFGAAEFVADASYRREEDGDDDTDVVVASASLLLASGLNFTVAGGTSDNGSTEDDATSFFAKIGYRTDLFSVGETRFSVDYFRGENAADFAAIDGDLPEATSIGLFAVQELRGLNTELYAGYRRFDIDDVFVGGVEQNVDSLDAIIIGGRIRF